MLTLAVMSASCVTSPWTEFLGFYAVNSSGFYWGSAFQVKLQGKHVKFVGYGSALPLKLCRGNCWVWFMYLRFGRSSQNQGKEPEASESSTTASREKGEDSEAQSQAWWPCRKKNSWLAKSLRASCRPPAIPHTRAHLCHLPNWGSKDCCEVQYQRLLNVSLTHLLGLTLVSLLFLVMKLES